MVLVQRKSTVECQVFIKTQNRCHFRPVALKKQKAIFHVDYLLNFQLTLNNKMDYVAALKILVIGESGVGKSSIILAFTTGDYNASFPATIGVDYKCKVMEVNGLKVKLGIWDTAGQERYRTLTNSFYRDAHGAILVYDVSEPKTLQKLNEWVDELQVYTTKKNIVCLVVGNKIDKPRAVPREAGQAFAQKHRMLFIESSAKTQEGINLAFEELVQKIIETPGLWETTGSSSNIRVASEEGRQQEESCYGSCAI